MTDDSPPIGGRARAPARHIEAPCGLGWDPIERCDWEAIAAVLPPPWPPGAQRQDLRYWAARERRRSCNRPSYRELAARWGVTEKGARLVCADVEWWADPRFGDERPERASQRGSSGADEGQTKGRRRADEGQAKGRPTPDAHAVVEHKGADEGQAKGRRRADQGQAKGSSGAPKDNSDRDTNSHTDREANLSAPPPERAEKRTPSAAERAQAEAAALFERLEGLRRTRHAGGRGLSAATWVPRCKTALSKSPAQDYIDALVWTLHDPAAAFHRGEDQRSPGPDRTVDLSLVLRHPEYALRRSWWGAQAPTPEELAEAEAAHAAGQPPPAWVERRGASPMGRRAAQDAERKRREDDEARAWLRANGHTPVGDVSDDDDVCF